MARLVLVLTAACIGFGLWKWHDLVNDGEGHSRHREHHVRSEHREEAVHERRSVEGTRTFRVQPGETLTLDLKAGGDVRVEGWDRPEVQVAVDGEAGVEMTQDGRGVRVAAGHERRGGRNDYEIRVPRSYNVEIESTGGDVRIQGVEGRFGGQTMGGDLELAELQGEVRLTTMGGDIQLHDSRVEGSVHTMGGEVKLENVTGSVKATTMGGSVIRTNSGTDGAGADEVRISSMGGDIKLDEAPAGARVETMGGEIHVGRAARFVKAETMGGDIEIGAVDGWVEATTMGGDVEVTMTGDPSQGDRHVDLSSMGGDVHLYLPEGLSMNVEVEIRFDPRRKGDFEVVSDFPLARNLQNDGDRGMPVLHASGQIAGGQHRVRIKTVNGDVYLHRAGR